MKDPVVVCYVVAYRDPGYIRSATLIAGLEALPHVQLRIARNDRRGLLRYAQTLYRLWRTRRAHDPDLYILGFRGHEIFWPVRWLTGTKPLIFDSFVSPSDSMLSERKWGTSGVLIGRIVHRIERRILHRADFLLTDTHLHSAFFTECFDIATEKLQHVYVGAAPDPNDERSARAKTLPAMRQRHSTEYPLNILFYGTFLPLHGIDVIVEAAKLCTTLPVHLTIVGGHGHALARFKDSLQYHRPTNITHRSWVPYDTLLTETIPAADLCLGGPFGGTPQARRVITGKTFEFLAQGKATIIGKTDEPVGLVDRVNCLLVEQNDAQALAASIRWACDHRSALAEIGARGAALYRERFDTAAIARTLTEVLDKVQ